MNDALYYVSYSDGGSTGSVQTARAPLSDCQPIMHGGKAVWYVTDNSAPAFYGLDDSGVSFLGGAELGTSSGAPTQPTTPTQPATPGNTWGPSSTTLPEVAKPSGARYQKGIFGYHRNDSFMAEIQPASCYSHDDIATIEFFDAAGKSRTNYLSHLTNLSAGSSVTIRCGYYPNYAGTVEVELCTATFPQNYTAHIQFSGKTANLTTGTVLNGSFQGYNAFALKTQVENCYYLFHLESGIAPQPAQPTAPTQPVTPAQPSQTGTGSRDGNSTFSSYAAVLPDGTESLVQQC